MSSYWQIKVYFLTILNVSLFKKESDVKFALVLINTTDLLSSLSSSNLHIPLPNGVSFVAPSHVFCLCDRRLRYSMWQMLPTPQSWLRSLMNHHLHLLCYCNSVALFYPLLKNENQAAVSCSCMNNMNGLRLLEHDKWCPKQKITFLPTLGINQPIPHID